ncbi:MAG: sigma-70 family RNA polymerase sigma factor [Ruminococcaceae bacterium]|nr:sigma-70 family RNA polymerase sigma factor [Oscillospiraceae bacterium]
MEDVKIVELYWQRNEQALSETKLKYGRFCNSIAFRILENKCDADECESDTYLKVWNTIPPKKPELLKTYLGAIVRNLSLDRIRKKNAQKRGGEMELSLSELEQCVSENKSVSGDIEAGELARMISAFLEELPEKECDVFLCRYWYFYSIKDISARFGFGGSKVKMMLLRTREKLRKYLEEEGVFI